PRFRSRSRYLLRQPLDQRQMTASAAERALRARFKHKPAVTDPRADQGADLEAAEKEARRQKLQAEKEAKLAARAAADEAERQKQLADEEHQLALKRAARKERKALTAAEQKARRDARYAARKARR